MDTLSGLNPGRSAVVIKVTGNCIFSKNAEAMGILPGTVVFMHKNSPFKKHLEINLRGYTLRILKKDAKKIEILKTSSNQSRRLKIYIKHLDFNA